MSQAAIAGAQRRRYPLAVHIATLFVVLLALAGLAIGGLAYFRSVAMLERAADDLFDRVARETTHEVQRIATPGEAFVDVLAQTRIATAANLAERLDALALVREAFAVSPNISAIYAGYATGDFFLVRRVPNSPDARLALGAPERAAYLAQSIERRGQERGIGTFVWFDADLARLAIENRPEYTAFDPRARPWYLDAANAAEQIKTAPYVLSWVASATTWQRRNRAHTASVSAAGRIRHSAGISSSRCSRQIILTVSGRFRLRTS